MTKKIFSNDIIFLGYRSNFQKSGGTCLRGSHGTDTNPFMIVVVLLSNGKNIPPRRNMVLCFRFKFSKKLNIKFLSKELHWKV